MSKVVIIGIDGLDPLLIDRWRKSLPNFSSIYNNLSEIIIESTFPPDSICAWTSIYTGENPAQHGLIESIDYLSGRKSNNDKDRVGYFKGRTFWDIVSNSGKKVCIINPFAAYPAWKVNGIMISGPVFEGGETIAYPEEVLKKYTLPPLGGMVDFPDRYELKEFVERTERLTIELGETGLKIYKDEKPDLFFLTFLTLDRIKHFLWRYTDEEDKYYPGDNDFKNSIKEFYIIFDSIIGGFKEALAEETVLLIISDHGHRRRCTKSLNLNEILRKKGYIKIYDSGLKGRIKKYIEMAKVFTLSTLSRYNLQDWIYRIARFVPQRKALKKSSYLIDKTGSLVSISNLCGANPYGGIDIMTDNSKEYERLREDIIKELEGINRAYGEEIIKWVKKREMVYSGVNSNKLPDILFELNENYGVGRDFFTKPITENYTHKKISGGHKREAVLLIYSNNDIIKNIPRPVSVTGLYEYILKIIVREKF